MYQPRDDEFTVRHRDKGGFNTGPLKGILIGIPISLLLWGGIVAGVMFWF